MNQLNKAQLEPGARGIFKFVIEHKAEVQVIQENEHGRTETFVGLKPDKEEAKE